MHAARDAPTADHVARSGNGHGRGHLQAGALTDADWGAAVAALREGGPDQVALACHINPDGDALGSMLATALALRQLGFRPLASFSNPFRLPRSLEGLAGREILVPPERVPAAPRVLVTFDTGSVDRLGDLADRVAAAETVIVVDHHVTNTGFGTHHLVDPAAPATAAVVEELLVRLGVPLDRDIAECLYVGLSTDTGSFRGAATTPAAHEFAARLLSTGIDPDEISRRLYDSRPVRSLHVVGAVLSRVVSEPTAAGGHGFSWSYVTSADLDRRDIGLEWVEGVVDMVRGSEESGVAMVAKEIGPEEWAVSLRSRGAVDVGALCVRLGGGGHRLSAGFTGRGPLESVVAAVRTTLDGPGLFDAPAPLR